MKICSRKRGGKLRDEREVEEIQWKGTSTVVLLVPRFNLENAFCKISALCTVQRLLWAL